MTIRRIPPRRMTPRVMRAWRRRRTVVGAGWAIASGLFLWFGCVVLLAFMPWEFQDAATPLVVVIPLIGALALAVGSAFGVLPGTRAPLVGASCRACRHDLTALLPGDARGVTCPRCGHTNTIRRDAESCGRCGYNTSGVPIDAAGVRTCPECGYERRLDKATLPGTF